MSATPQTSTAGDAERPAGQSEPTAKVPDADDESESAAATASPSAEDDGDTAAPKTSGA